MSGGARDGAEAGHACIVEEGACRQGQAGAVDLQTASETAFGGEGEIDQADIGHAGRGAAGRRLCGGRQYEAVERAGQGSGE